ncbi:MAG: hypothetical protein QXI33_01420 [Candidatus Pacearchaeota archaeon]
MKMGVGKVKRYYEQKRIKRVEKGAIFSAFPHFIAPGKHGNHEAPGMFIRDIDTGEVYTGIIKGLNPNQVSLDKEYKVVIRHIGNPLKDNTRLAFLEEIVEEGNKVHVRTLEKSKIKSHLFAYFLRFTKDINGNDIYRYKVFVHKNANNVSVSVGDYVFGIARNISHTKNLFYLSPLAIVDETTYLENENIIFRE